MSNEGASKAKRVKYAPESDHAKSRTPSPTAALKRRKMKKAEKHSQKINRLSARALKTRHHKPSRSKRQSKKGS